MRTVVQGQIKHLAWRPGDDAQETSGGAIEQYKHGIFSHIVSGSPALWLLKPEGVLPCLFT